MIYCNLPGSGGTVGAGRKRKLRAERIECALQPKVWSLNRPGLKAVRHVVLLTDGAGEIEAGPARIALDAPAIAWLGRFETARLRLDAGSSGMRGWTDDETLFSAIGEEAESASLAALAGRDFSLSLVGFSEDAAAIGRCLTAVMREQADRRSGSGLMIAALTRIMLVVILRLSGGIDAEADRPMIAGGEREALVQRFRQLVEMNFRSHWTVAQYAAALSISPDRLHAVCTGTVGKSPKRLVGERLAHEASTRLERSSLTIEQLGHLLGFSDPAHFSNFFRRMRGMPPGRYRRLAAQARAEGRRAETTSFAEWP
ncbi:MAG: AraC family transcriptional regulator [Rhizobiaceae bacterium]|nr:AraC family transcriptional regulator [Rhizobiaceae bacterium]MCV0405745.1 AraC family transcriptional regulator [Rhizobiaceae bacterium]